MAKRKSNRLLTILISVAVLLVILAVVGKKSGWIGKQKEIEVELAKVENKTIVEKVSASGDVQPETEVKISPDVSGEIIDLYVKEGDSVIQGQLLIKIRADNYLSALDRVNAQLNQTKANLAEANARYASAEAQFERTKFAFERSKQLREENVISDADYQLAEANYKVSESDLKSARQNIIAAEYIVKSTEASVKDASETLRKTNVYAPANGIVSKLSVEKGERVVGTSMMTGTEMLRIADLNLMEVQIDVNENDIIRVSLGDTAIIDVDSYSYIDKKFKGLVTEISNTANTKPTPEAVTEFKVKVRILHESYSDLLEKNNYPFRPGMTASVEIITDIKDNVLSVPLSAVTTRSPGEVKNKEDNKEGKESEAGGNAVKSDTTSAASDVEVVFVNENGKAKKVTVKTGISDYDNIEIIEGLAAGQEVVSGPFVVVSKRLQGGEPIKSLADKNNRNQGKNEAGVTVTVD
ncbi:MAG TPA: efflux RND transporter periplasmic adaptor subunit [Cyclobacteriaceae bacterium]|nr:efflux RND transporter periplasmic adaptor subunit [Cyclobacteriaceae bacterium]